MKHNNSLKPKSLAPKPEVVQFILQFSKSITALTAKRKSF